MNTVDTLLSFMCLVAFFQSCYGLKCYSCHSNRTFNLECNIIVNDRFLIDCKKGENCGQMFKRSKNNETETSRMCLSDGLLRNFNTNIKKLEKDGMNVEFIFCNMNKCNGLFQLANFIS